MTGKGKPASAFYADSLIEKHRALVGFTLARHFGGLPADLMEELQAVGNMALVQAARRYDASMGNTFSTYAVRCIRGVMQRELHQQFSVGFGGLTRFRAAERDAVRPQLLPFDAPLSSTNADVAIPSLPEAAVLQKAACTELWRAVDTLPDPAAREVVYLHYLGGLTIAEAGAHLGLTPRRARGLHARALKRLRACPQFLPG